MKENTFIIPCIREDLLETCLDKLYRYTVPNFYVYVIDQTVGGFDHNRLRDKFKNLMFIRTPKTDIHTKGNLGFAKATNLAISMVDTPYFTMMNDDVEMINRRWWSGVMDSFKSVDEATPNRPCVMVNPASIKLPDWSVGLPSGQDFHIIPYKNKYTNDDWDFLVNEEHYVNEHLTIMPGSVIDGVTMYCSVFKTVKFLEIGMLDEKHYAGGGEDYCWCARANMMGYRSVGTTLSWVYHHWSKSFAKIQDKEAIRDLIDENLNWNNLNQEWGEGFDLWGYKCPQCSSSMRCGEDYGTIATCPNHPEEKYELPEITIVPL